MPTAKMLESYRRKNKSQLNIFIDEGLHSRLKAYAATSRSSILEAVEALIEEGIPELREVHVAEAGGLKVADVGPGQEQEQHAA